MTLQPMFKLCYINEEERPSVEVMEAQKYNHNADSQCAKLGHAILSGRFASIDKQFLTYHWLQKGECLTMGSTRS